jgi:hypothetical protein
VLPQAGNLAELIERGIQVLLAKKLRRVLLAGLFIPCRRRVLRGDAHEVANDPDETITMLLDVRAELLLERCI